VSVGEDFCNELKSWAHLVQLFVNKRGADIF